MTDIFCIFQFVKTNQWHQLSILRTFYTHYSQNIQSKCALSFLLSQQSADTVNWQQWIQDNSVKLRQLQTVVVRYIELNEKDDSEELEDWLWTLQWYWTIQQHQTQDSELSEEDLEILQKWREWLSPCEASDDTQVQCISSSHDNTNSWQVLCWLWCDVAHFNTYLSGLLNSAKMIRVYKAQPDRNGNTHILNLHSTDYIAKTNWSKALSVHISWDLLNKHKNTRKLRPPASHEISKTKMYDKKQKIFLWVCYLTFSQLYSVMQKW